MYQAKPLRPAVQTVSLSTFVSCMPSDSPVAAPRAVSHKRVSRVRLNWFLLGSVFGIGMSIALHAFASQVVVPRYEAFLKNREQANLPQLASASTVISDATIAPAEENTGPHTLDLIVDKGDTLISMLLDNDVDEGEAHDVVEALSDEFNPRALKVGQRLSLTLARHERLGDKAAVQELAIKMPLSTIELERQNDGGFAVEALKEILNDEPVHATGKVRSSLYQAALDAGIPTSAMADIVAAYSFDVDFQRDIHPGNKIEVLMDKKVTKDGRAVSFGNARYAKLTLDNRTLEIFRFADANGTDGWFDAKGNSVKKSLLKTPVNAARISSGFGMRRHPILGYGKMHRGVDFAAPTGTPIFAAGDGLVAFRGWKNGYGNYVQIRHNGTYSTAYGHISRFGNIRVGSRVKQGQVIAYVGSTGMSTGPHLHYEVHQNGVQVNPAAQRFNTSQALAGAQLQKFKARMGEISAEIASLNTSAQLASR
jgi:murein DD-endopeptidase MepM/ murein hydrolase activator NlpD